MSIGYNKEFGFFRRVWNKIFRKKYNLLSEPIQYTQKEVKEKMQQIVEYLKYGFDFKNKYIDIFDNLIQSTNIYFYNKDQKEIQNSFDTYMYTVGKRVIKLSGDSKLIFSNPVIRSGILLEVYPVLNLAKTNRLDYIMQIYINTIRIISRKKLKPKKISKNTKKVEFLNGLNSKEVFVYTDKISSIKNKRYNNLNKLFVYIIAQVLYETIENKPFLLELSREEEQQIKKVRYYISKSYPDYKTFLMDYIFCNARSIERKISENTDVNNLDELEEKIRKGI